MVQTRRGTVLGKRSHQDADAPSPVACDMLATPDSTPDPKRPRTSFTLTTDDSNKENVPPFKNGLGEQESVPHRPLPRRTASEDDLAPVRARPGPSRSASLSSLPSTPTSSKELAAPIVTPPPTPPAALLPLPVRLRALLRSTCNNSQSQIAGRDVERLAITQFFSSFIDGSAMDSDNVTPNLFLSGSPGTGKTALVNAVIRDLFTDNEHQVKVIFVNCMALKNIDALWERLAEDLSDASNNKVVGKKLKGREAVKALFQISPIKCVLVLDELDHITPNDQSLASIYSLTDESSSKLRIVGIANTHTLTSGNTSSALAASSTVQTLHFAPYTANQLKDILQSRLDTLSDVATAVKAFLPNPPLVLLAKKIASMTGDVRSLFEVLRGAIDLAVEASNKSAGENPLDAPLKPISPQHILQALKAHAPATAAAPAASGPSTSGSANSEIVNKVQALNLHPRLVLLVILIASKRLQAGLSLGGSTPSTPTKKASPVKRTTSLPAPIPASAVGIETGSLHSFYSAVLCRADSMLFEPVSRSEFGDLLSVLEGVGLVSLSSSLLSSCSSPTKGGAKGVKRTFSRSSSFAAGSSKHGAGAVGEVRLVEGIWGDEVLRGLGATTEVSPDILEEEVRALWMRELSRLNKDVKALNGANGAKADTFAGAFED